MSQIVEQPSQERESVRAPEYKLAIEETKSNEESTAEHANLFSNEAVEKPTATRTRTPSKRDRSRVESLTEDSTPATDESWEAPSGRKRKRRAEAAPLGPIRDGGNAALPKKFGPTPKKGRAIAVKKSKAVLMTKFHNHACATTSESEDSDVDSRPLTARPRSIAEQRSKWKANTSAQRERDDTASSFPWDGDEESEDDGMPSTKGKKYHCG